MTFAEIILLIVFLFLIFYFLKPLQRRLENILYKFFRSKLKSQGEIIDVTPTKKDKTNGKI